MQVKQTYLKNENNEVISPVTSVNSVYGENGQNLLDLFYPVGSYYETSDIDFNPNTSWGGIWTQDTIGYVTVGADTVGDSELEKHNLPSLNVGITYGEMEHTLTVNEMPIHTHPANNFVYNPAQSVGNKHQVAVGSGNGILSYDIDGDINLKVNNAGGSQPHNNIQPSIGVIRWHRTA